MKTDRELWQEYFKKQLSKPHYKTTELAVERNRSGNMTALDYGCGTGCDIPFLAAAGYQVIGFDINEDAIGICKERFQNNPFIQISVSTFEDYSPVKCGVLVAHNSLYFADPERFAVTWMNLVNSVESGGVVSVNLMGKKDSWVENFRMPISSFTRQEVDALFAGFEILQFGERDEKGNATAGVKHWHSYSIVALKN